MAKRIFRTIVLTVVLAVLLTTTLIVSTLYNVYETRITDELRLEADYIVHALEMADDAPTYLENISSHNRITLVNKSGTVLYDSMADPADMEDHSKRPEVIDALNEGSGESVRISNTISEMTLYYAERTEDGDVLRIASTRSSVLGMFFEVMPIIIGILLVVAALSFSIARITAKFIVAPINSLNLDSPLENDAYDELAPLLTRMERQHSQINRQLQALERARTEMAAIMENMREGMLLLDDKNTVLSMNESAAAIFDVNARERIGSSILSVSRDAQLQDMIKAAGEGKGDDMLMKRGQRTYRIFVSPVMRGGAAQGTVLLVLDVTERFAAEKSRREFTANVSHELKTPLTSISGFAEIIRDGIARPEDVQNFAGRICSEAGRLINLVNDILELSRLDEKQGLGERSRLALGCMLRDLANEFEIMAGKKNIDIALECSEAEVECYPTQIREMFYNLIDNAVRYTPEGGRIEIKAVEHPGYIECSVSDNGIGIPEEHRAHVFERFYRVDKSHSRATGGTGLGLAIVKHVAEIHDAELELESGDGKGTRITVRLKK